MDLMKLAREIVERDEVKENKIRRIADALAAVRQDGMQEAMGAIRNDLMARSKEREQESYGKSGIEYHVKVAVSQELYCYAPRLNKLNLAGLVNNPIDPETHGWMVGK